MQVKGIKLYEKQFWFLLIEYGKLIKEHCVRRAMTAEDWYRCKSGDMCSGVLFTPGGWTARTDSLSSINISINMDSPAGEARH